MGILPSSQFFFKYKLIINQYKQQQNSNKHKYNKKAIRALFVNKFRKSALFTRRNNRWKNVRDKNITKQNAFKLNGER